MFDVGRGKADNGEADDGETVAGAGCVAPDRRALAVRDERQRKRTSLYGRQPYRSSLTGLAVKRPVPSEAQR